MAPLFFVVSGSSARQKGAQTQERPGISGDQNVVPDSSRTKIPIELRNKFFKVP